MLRVAARRLAALSCFPWESSRAAVVSSSAFSSNGTGAYEYRSTFFSDSFNLGPHFYLHHRGFASDVVSKDEHTLIPEVPATAAAIKNLASKITYDEYNHERYPLGDPSKRAFAYFVLTGGRFVYASLVRLLILKFVLSMTATKDVLPLASIEVDLSNIEPGTIVVVKWHESLSSSSTELERKLKRQRKLTSQPFVTHRRMKKESKTLNGLSWSVPALILVVFHCQTLGTLGGGFALVMALTMMSLAEFVRDQCLIISKYLLTLSSMTTNC